MINLILRLENIFRIIHECILTTIYGNLGKFQFGFRDGLVTRERLFSVQVLIQRARDVYCDVFACFLDFEKQKDT